MQNETPETKSSMMRAEKKVSRKLSSVWLVPIVAVAIGIWMAYDTVTSRGQMITIELASAEGIEAGKTLIKTHDVAVGRVEHVRLSEDFERAVVEVRMYQDTERMLNSETQFWVVKPRVGRQGISGLSTLLSGAYIQLQIGDARDNQKNFVALDAPPVTPADMDGLRVHLTADDATMLGVGDPVLYRGYTVGRVETAVFDHETRSMDYQIFVQAPYHSLVTPSVRFWMSSGAQMDLDSQGVRVEIGSLESLLGGGVTFGAFEPTNNEDMVSANSEFRLFVNEEEASQARYTKVIRYVVLLEDSVRGLSKGSPVEYKGVRVGTVEEVPYRGVPGSSSSLLDLEIPVLIRFEPERISETVSEAQMLMWQAELAQMFRVGLRASLRAGNLLTGALFVDLNFYPDETYEVASIDSEYPVFPSVTNSFTQLDQKLTALLDSLNDINLDEFVDTATETLRFSEQTLESVAQAADQLAEILNHEDTRELPGALVRALDELERTFSGYSVDAPAYNELTQSIERLNAILRDLEPVSETLRDTPSALFFDTKVPEDPPLRRDP
ncbi:MULTISPECIES: intermembrane transport protein PqiB [Gammaproteobacteria]|uniref:intermembrane transport protein PqiB n=1 Tax=Gammaproteobacteria TaxID=1236 RepID=UPI000DCF778E|nr:MULTISPECIES: intermembrane transport protein PqiB [Gammaproteobacteria]RTE86541.1 intermembrane transport protein PqiB [Aliidiomarina sp. B3213]TCZ90904.1 intermembrane transport protein PqiB [Lysobacter sp. N42]